MNDSLIRMKRVAIIGAGPCGLGLMIAFRYALLKGAEIPKIVCFEKQDDWGGLWNYTWRTGTDEYGDSLHHSMYQCMWSNGPKECLEYPDYSLLEHFGKPLPSYPPRSVLHDYIVGRASKSNIRQYTKFNMCVESVVFENGKFALKVWDKKNDFVFSDTFDYVVVATGHFSVPYTPEYEGLSSFPGRILHAHDYRNAEEFKGKDVIVLGSSFSAEDIALQCWKYGSNSVTIGYRHNAMNYKWPDGIKEHHRFEKVDGNTAFFKDGQKQLVDVIIYCTGYLHHFPFMEDSLKLKTANVLYPLGLYKGVVFQNNHDLFYMGMQDQVYTLPMFESQAWFVRDLIMSKITVPSDIEVETDIEKWATRQTTLVTPRDRYKYQTDYIKDLIDHLTDYHKIDLSTRSTYHEVWVNQRKDDIVSYRDHTFTSTVTDTPAVDAPAKWADTMDGTLDEFLK